MGDGSELVTFSVMGMETVCLDRRAACWTERANGRNIRARGGF